MLNVMLLNRTPFLELMNDAINQLPNQQSIFLSEIQGGLQGSIRVDIIIVDVDLYSIDELQAMIEKEKHKQIIGMTASQKAEELLAWIEMGLDSLLEKTPETISRLESILPSVKEKHYYLPDTLIPIMLQEMDKFHAEKRGRMGSGLHDKKFDLTSKEIEIAYLMRLGMKNPEIARNLGISEGTVKVHVSHIYKKLGIKKRRTVVELLGSM